MKALVTGAAGFIGSTLVDQLLNMNIEVVGVDSFTPYYSPQRKELNLRKALANRLFTLHRIDLAVDDLSDVLSGVTDIFHQAGQPGVRSSWGPEFLEYVNWNVWATQRLLEHSKGMASLRSFVAASSSSIYGTAEHFPTRESDSPQPISPYGVTKLASEHLCTLYGKQFEVPTVALRYFTVFGPRQRPDMAIGKIIKAGLTNQVFPLLGDGSQSRDFSFVSDVAQANILSSAALRNGLDPGSVFNVGGGNPVSMAEVIRLVSEIERTEVKTVSIPREAGDPMRTGADVEAIFKATGWVHKTSFMEGLEQQISWSQAEDQ